MKKKNGILSKLNEYVIPLTLANGSELEIKIFDDDSQSFILSYHYTNGQRSAISLTNRYRLVVGYKNGVVHDCELMMDIAFPKKRGQRYKYGMDLSKDSRFIVILRYEKAKSRKGKAIFNLVHQEINGEKTEDASITMTSKQIYFPFPIYDLLEVSDVGLFKVPFSFSCPGNTLDVRHFDFPESIRRYPSQ